jgi:hypothetical protein
MHRPPLAPPGAGVPIFALVGVVLTMAGPAFALARFT